MNAGKMDKLVTVQRNQSFIGTLHEVVDDWQDLAEIWCQITTPTAKELRETAEIQHNTLDIRCWPTDITHEDRLIYQDKIYNIDFVLDKKDHLQIRATMNE